MWEYRWVETTAGKADADELSRLGADGWEAVSMAEIGEHFGELWVRVLMKRPRANRVLDLDAPTPMRAVAS